MKLIFNALLLLLALSSVLTTATALRVSKQSTDGGDATSTKKVVFAQVVHRHGARTPIVDRNEGIICGSIGCGELTPEGKDMLYQLGQWARDRYMVQSGAHSNSTTAYIANNSYYFPTEVVQRSTDVRRTLQSAAAFLQGLYSRANSSFYPVIANMPLDQDILLFTKSNPSYFLPKEIDDEQIHVAWATEYILPNIQKSTWQQLGVELSLEHKCHHGDGSDKHLADIAKCIHMVYDVAASYASSGLLSESKYPTTYQLYHSGLLYKVKSHYHEMLYVYNASVHTDRHRGPLGREIITEFLSQINDYINGNQEAVLREYSAHDITLIPLADTLGGVDLMPPFGNAYWVELLQDSDDGSYNIRFLSGSPEQTPGSHRYTMSAFNLTCTSSSGESYAGGEDGCPLADFQRYYATRVGSSSKGYCYVRSDYLNTIDCDSISGSGAAGTGGRHVMKEENGGSRVKRTLGQRRLGHPESASELCKWYRTMCPQYACPSGSYLQYPDLNCAAFPSGGTL